MMRTLNRTAIFLNLAAFLGVCAFCISIDAPLMQQDILNQCRETLLMHRVSIRGLTTDGRDVLLSGSSQAAIVSPSVRTVLEQVSGVRVVKVRILSGNETTGAPSQALTELAPAAVQRKIDRVLQNQSITFKTDTTTLTPESELALDKIAAYLAETPSLLCEIRGYDSPAGPAHQNWVLALQRALSAQDYLENKGVADWRLSTRAFHPGEADSNQGNKANRALDFLMRAKEDVRTKE